MFHGNKSLRGRAAARGLARERSQKMCLWGKGQGGGIGQQEGMTPNKVTAGPQPSAESSGAGTPSHISPKPRPAGRTLAPPGQPVMGLTGHGTCSRGEGAPSGVLPCGRGQFPARQRVVSAPVRKRAPSRAPGACCGPHHGFSRFFSWGCPSTEVPPGFWWDRVPGNLEKKRRLLGSIVTPTAQLISGCD